MIISSMPLNVLSDTQRTDIKTHRFSGRGEPARAEREKRQRYGRRGETGADHVLYNLKHTYYEETCDMEV